MPDILEIGELAYCQDETGEWIGEVIAVQDTIVTVKWFGDNLQRQLSRKQVIPFARYLDELGRSRKLKIVYELFFGDRLTRMPQARLQELQHVLRQHGIEFDRSTTRADAPFKMWPNVAHLPKAERERRIPHAVLPDEVTEWLPKWLVTDPLPPSSRDPLGLQADAGRLADCLLPGLTVFTSRAGYFFFLAWAVREINRLENLDLASRRERLNRLERALVVCETLYHGVELKQCQHLGQRVKGRLLAEPGLTIRIPDRILKNQHTSGCYNLYRTAMSSCGFWEEEGALSAIGKLPFRLTTRGEKLADWFGKRPEAAELFKWAMDISSVRAKEKVQAWGAALCFETFTQNNTRTQFLEGLLYVTGDCAEAVIAADKRLSTMQTLARSRLPRPGGLVGQTLLGSELTGIDLTIDELPETDNELNNAAVLLYFYRHPIVTGSGTFLEAAVYELLGLALNAIWKSLLDDVTPRGRLSIADWLNHRIEASQVSRLWHSPLEQAANTLSLLEEQLVERILNGELLLEHSLALLARVLANVEHRRILLERLSDTAVFGIVSRSVLNHGHKSVEEVLLQLVPHLVQHHQQVSERKGKQTWLRLDGPEIYADDAHVMALGFHSYRFPQLFSVLKDLDLNWTNYDHNIA